MIDSFKLCLVFALHVPLQMLIVGVHIPFVLAERFAFSIKFKELHKMVLCYIFGSLLLAAQLCRIQITFFTSFLCYSKILSVI